MERPAGCVKFSDVVLRRRRLPPFPLATTPPLYSAAALTSTTCNSPDENGGRGAANGEARWLREICQSCSPVMVASPPFPLETMPPLYSAAVMTSNTADCPDDDREGVAANVVARRLLKRVTQFGAVLRERLENSKNNQDVSSLDAEQTKEEGSSPPDHDAIADQFINVLLNVDHDMQKFMIIKLVSNIDTRMSVEEVLSTIPIISQATYNKSAVNREECTPQYAVDQRAFRNHTRGENRGLPRDSDPSVRTIGEHMALFRAKKKVLKSILGIGTIEQWCLILLQVISDPSIRNILSSICINMKEIELGQLLLRCARKLIGCTQHSTDKNKGQCRTSVVKHSVVKSLCLGLLPTPTKEMSNEGSVISSKREISMRDRPLKRNDQILQRAERRVGSC